MNIYIITNIIENIVISKNSLVLLYLLIFKETVLDKIAL